MKRTLIRMLGCIMSAVGLGMTYDSTIQILTDDTPGTAFAASTGTGNTVASYSCDKLYITSDVDYFDGGLSYEKTLLNEKAKYTKTAEVWYVGYPNAYYSGQQTWPNSAQASDMKGISYAVTPLTAAAVIESGSGQILVADRALYYGIMYQVDFGCVSSGSDCYSSGFFDKAVYPLWGGYSSGLGNYGTCVLDEGVAIYCPSSYISTGIYTELGCCYAGGSGSSSGSSSGSCPCYYGPANTNYSYAYIQSYTDGSTEIVETTTNKLEVTTYTYTFNGCTAGYYTSQYDPSQSSSYTPTSFTFTNIAGVGPWGDGVGSTDVMLNKDCEISKFILPTYLTPCWDSACSNPSNTAPNSYNLVATYQPGTCVNECPAMSSITNYTDVISFSATDASSDSGVGNTTCNKTVTNAKDVSGTFDFVGTCSYNE